MAIERNLNKFSYLHQIFQLIYLNILAEADLLDPREECREEQVVAAEEEAGENPKAVVAMPLCALVADTALLFTDLDDVASAERASMNSSAAKEDPIGEWN